MPQPVEPDVLPPELASGLDQAEGAGTWGAWLATLSTGEDYSAPPPPLPEGVIPKVRGSGKMPMLLPAGSHWHSPSIVLPWVIYSPYIDRLQVTPDDFTKYLVTVGRKLEGYEAARGDIVQHEPATASFPFGTELLSASSSGLAQAMTDVPLLFFQEDFNVDSSDVWTHLGSIVSTQRHQEVMEQLTQQLVSRTYCSSCPLWLSKEYIHIDCSQFSTVLCCRIPLKPTLHTKLQAGTQASLRRRCMCKALAATCSSCWRWWSKNAGRYTALRKSPEKGLRVRRA